MALDKSQLQEVGAPEAASARSGPTAKELLDEEWVLSKLKEAGIHANVSESVSEAVSE